MNISREIGPSSCETVQIFRNFLIGNIAKPRFYPSYKGFRNKIVVGRFSLRLSLSFKPISRTFGSVYLEKSDIEVGGGAQIRENLGF